jgi:hypothetical protein
MENKETTEEKIKINYLNGKRHISEEKESYLFDYMKNSLCLTDKSIEFNLVVINSLSDDYCLLKSITDSNIKDVRNDVIPGINPEKFRESAENSLCFMDVIIKSLLFDLKKMQLSNMESITPLLEDLRSKNDEIRKLKENFNNKIRMIKNILDHD